MLYICEYTFTDTHFIFVHLLTLNSNAYVKIYYCKIMVKAFFCHIALRHFLFLFLVV